MTILPPEAGNLDAIPFEPNNDWLSTASGEQQFEAMQRWFLDRYEDPVNETPWDGEDKRYMFVWGGPYDPNEVLQTRFSGIVDNAVLQKLVEELWRDVGDEWAPIYHEGFEYDEYVSHLIVTDRHDPYRFLNERISEVFSVLEASQLNDRNRQLLHQMAHSSLIAALEAYLADTVSYWVGNDDRVLRRFITTNKDFQEKSLTVSQLFERLENLTVEVKKYLAEFVWHRLDKVKPVIMNGLDIPVPDIGPLVKEVLVRHDIVHRAGRGRDGEIVDLSIHDLNRVKEYIEQFSFGIEEELLKRFPPDDVG